MQKAATVLDVIRSVVNVTAFFCGRSLESWVPGNSHAQFGKRLMGKGPSLSTSPAAYFTREEADGKGPCGTSPAADFTR